MFLKLLGLISQVFFYELDLGVDIKVANQQRNLAFTSCNQKDTTIFDQASRLFNRTFYIHLNFHSETYEPLKSLNYEPIHFILTTAWLVLGGLFQSFVILKNIQKQSYIPLIWKVAIMISSFFLVGPLFIFYFCIYTILISNASTPEKERILLLVGSMIKLMNL
jgi:hypothetical protein